MVAYFIIQIDTPNAHNQRGHLRKLFAMTIVGVLQRGSSR